jgi:hypothetical protein
MSFFDGSAWQWETGCGRKTPCAFRRAVAWLGLSYVLVSTFFAPTKMLAATPLNILQSTGLAGAVIVLVLLHSRTPIGSQRPVRG